MESKIEDKVESLEKPDNEAGNNTKIDCSQSVAFVNRIKLEDLRSTKSSPHRNLELHHTRSFSEIYHLHPSCTDISGMSPICPKPKAISDLQHKVPRPESVLELSDLGALTESDDESEEDVMTTQQRGDEAMKIFLESNVSIPLDGAMTSSSLSEDTLDSDIASESELIVGNWERGGRDSIASTGSSIEKRFLTPSGQLLYREHQVDSMLDTKRLKLTPSSSERPISPLAMRKSDENVKYKTSSGGSESGTSGNESCEKRRRYKTESDSDSEEQENDMNREIPVDNTDGEKIQNTDCDCGLRLQDLKQVVHNYDVQCEELINRSKEQCDEIKTLRKDNVNMHREHNRLQVLIEECYQNEDALKENMAAMSKVREGKVDELKQTVQELENNLQQKASEIVTLQSTIDSHVEERAKHVKTIKEINKESKALLEVLGKELGQEKAIEIESEENAEAIVILLKTRRHSLPDDFKNFSKNLNQATGSDVVNEIENHMKEDFREISAGYKDSITKIQQAEKGMGKILKWSASLESLLKQRKGINNSDQSARQPTELEGKLRELKRENDSLIQANKVLEEDCTKWKLRCDQIFKQNEKNSRGKATLKFRKDKTTASEELKKLKRYLKERRRSYSEPQLETLQDNFARPENSKAGTSSSTEKTANVKGLSDLEDRLKHLSQITEDLSQKIERSNEHLGNKTASAESKKKQVASSNGGTKDFPDRMLAAFFGGKLFSVVKGMYSDHMSTLQDNIHSREQECRHLQEQLAVTESNEEVTRCYIASLKRAIAIVQDELRNCKNKNHDLKTELRELKDQMLVANTEREMALFYCKKNGVVNGALAKHEDCSDTSSHPAQGSLEDIYGTIEETSYFKKHIKYAGT